MTQPNLKNVPFSQRSGFEPIPQQLVLGQISNEMRRQFRYYLGLEIDKVKISGSEYYYFSGEWRRLASDFHVLFLKKSYDTFEFSTYHFVNNLSSVIANNVFHEVFDLVEFFLQHSGCSSKLKENLATVFVSCQSAYRVVDGQIIAVGTDQQAIALEAALSAASINGNLAARQHLVAAGLELRNSNWSGSVRESIHAVESMTLALAPSADTLGKALNVLEEKNYLHGGLKQAFKALYGYSSDEQGVRHSLVFSDEAKVDEADALFMLGACAAFVSYLIARCH